MVQAEKRHARGAVVERKTMTGGEALIESIIAQGVQQIFGLPGVQLDGAFDALHARKDRIKVLHTRHEQAAAYMAMGYARVTNDVGSCFVVPGPGLLNATAALSTGYACNDRVLCMTGQIQSDMIDFGRGLLHEIPNQIGMIRSVTKWAGRATKPEEIPGLVHDAFSELRSGRPRPVEIEIPPDTLFAVSEVDLIAPVAAPVREAGEPMLLEQAAKILAGAKKPLIWAGGGVLRSAAWDELRQVAETLGAPVVLTANGKSAMSDRHPLVLNVIGAIDILKEPDAILCVGSRFVDAATLPWGIGGLDIPVVQVDIDPDEVSRNYPATVNIVADAKAALGALAGLLGSSSLNTAWTADEIKGYKERAWAKAMGIGPQAEYAMAIRRALPDDGIYLAEVTQIGYWSNFAMPMYEPLTYIGTGYQGTLGYGFPTALGAKIAKPEKVVVSANGDGGFGFCLNELATAAMHNIAAITVVFNDGAYGNVKRIQTEQFDGRTIASDLRNPDYMTLAKAFGITGRRAEGPEALQKAIEVSIVANEPTLIEVPMKPVPNPWRAIGYR